MQAYPHVVSNHGALDDTLMRAAGSLGAIVSKGGAEGFQGIGIRTPDGPLGRNCPQDGRWQPGW